MEPRTLNELWESVCVEVLGKWGGHQGVRVARFGICRSRLKTMEELMPCTHELIFARKLTFALAAFLAGTVFAPAFAQPPQLVQKDGLLVLPNVRLETAAIPVNSAVRAAPTEAGLRAYRDEKTGQLRSAFPEELIVEAVEAPRVNDPAGATVILLPNGGTRAILDESFMSNAIVHRDANGKLHMECVPGSSLASALLRGAPSGVKEHSHVH